MDHTYYMQRALQLAEKGRRTVSPNPAVGALIVKKGRLIGEGYHQGPGTLHAEISAIEQSGESLTGSTLYTTLEPCCSRYEGKIQPPCTERIISEGISEVVIAAIDPNPYVRSKGISKLREAGIKVTQGILEDEARLQNEVYILNQKEKRPFVHLKIAQTVDGKIATEGGDSQWITDEKARENVQLFRALYDSVLIGGETARKDNPHLTIRLDNFQKRMTRIILSSSLKLDPSANIFCKQQENPTLIFTTPGKQDSQKEPFLKKGITIIECGNDRNELSPHEILTELFNMGIMSVFVEGGSTLFTSFLKNQLFDRITFYIAPCICGKGIESVGNLDTSMMSEALRLNRTEISVINNQPVLHAWR